VTGDNNITSGGHCKWWSNEHLQRYWFSRLLVWHHRPCHYESNCRTWVQTLLLLRHQRVYVVTARQPTTGWPKCQATLLLTS